MTETPENQAPESTNVEGQAAEEGQGLQEQTTNNWFAQFKDEDLGYLQNKGWNNEEGLGKMFNAYKEMESYRGVKDEQLLRIPKGGDEEGWAKVYRQLGRPDEIAGYTQDFGEGVQLDKGRMEWFGETAHKLNLSKKQHEDLVKAAYEYENNIISAADKDAEIQRTQNLEELKNAWGDKYNEREHLAKRAFRQFAEGSEQQVDALEEMMGSNADVIRLFAKIGEGLGEDKMPESGNENKFGYTKEQAKADVADLKAELKSDKDRLAEYNKGKGQDYEKMQKLMKLAFGE